MPDEKKPAEVAEVYSSKNTAVWSNSSRSLHSWVDATGFRTHGLQYRSLGQAGMSRLAEEFLVNTRFVRHDVETKSSIQTYFLDPTYEMLSRLGEYERDPARECRLPAGPKLRREVGEVLARRHSSRLYTGDPIDFPYLATIVRSAGAITRQAAIDLASGEQATLNLRTVPSGGGLYPIDLWVAALHVNGLARGVYRFDPRLDNLVSMARADERPGETMLERLLASFAVPEEILSLSRACALFLMIGYPWRALRKYGNRGLRYVFIEAGAIAENIHLATEALGFGSVDCASVYDDEAHEALGLDGTFSTLIHVVVIGYSG